jgi:hypothetical protein
MSMVRSAVSIGAGMVLVLLVLELVCRLLPVSTATRTGYTHDSLVRTYPAHHRFTVSTGWDLKNAQVLPANGQGFAAQHEFAANPLAVALIGDSHVEASALPPELRPAAQLEAELGARRLVYSLGAPGTSLLDFAETARLVAESFPVGRTVVVLSVGDIRQSLCGSGQIAGPCLDASTGRLEVERQLPASTLKRIARQSALAQYVFSQLKVSPADLGPAALTTARALVPGGSAAPAAAGSKRNPPTPGELQLEARIAELFFQRLRPHQRGPVVFVLHHGVDAPPEATTDIARFAERARAEGHAVVDLAFAYADHRRHSALSLTIGPYDRHLNALGTAILAREVASSLRQLDRPLPPHGGSSGSGS